MAAWALGWGCWIGLAAAGLAPGLALGAAVLAASALALRAQGRWRRLLAAGGFPLSLLALGSAPPPWVWLVLLVPLALAYPLRAWRDAPFFPTPAAALDGLEALVTLAPGARVLDAGCGLGHGLMALRRIWPQAQLAGVEWSAPLAALARWRCRSAAVRRGDMWLASWGGQDLVYLFQRPESMARAAAKAEREMARGAWLVSLEFEVPGRRADACLRREGRRPVWAYRVGFSSIEGGASR
ncbi:MAG: class I SAM-dependent methyltransferase [Burkholderiales bacterium]|nr:class I SAM-dependent methyltransferase [Burkholderiales bacterium]MDE2455296.1 class I SAM-dependent methyltransferase [Burkholderiales bacterium]